MSESFFSFSYYNNEGRHIAVEYKNSTVEELVEKFDRFLKFAGIEYTGELQIVDNSWEKFFAEEKSIWYEDEDDEEYSKEYCSSQVKSWFDSYPKSNGDKEENFDLKDCFEVQDKLSLESGRWSK
jgi:hypothetical protein